MEKYTDLSKKLGRGSFGSVKLVQRNTDKKLLAMKVIDLTTEEAAKNAYNEPNILEKLQHPNIVKFYETFVLKDCLHLIMEYCEQGDLQQKVREARTKLEYFSEEEVMEWFVQVCLAIKQLHDNHIIHRDIKVHNTFLTSEGLVKLGDFGISKQLENTGDMGKTWLGTPFYVSPEMLSHSISSYKSDMWMLGCLLHELCSLEKPFFGDNIPTVIRKIMFEDYSPVPDHYSDLVHNLIGRLLDKNPEKRPSINDILEIPEIREEIDQLLVKYSEAYQTEPFMSSLKAQPTQEPIQIDEPLLAKRWASEKISSHHSQVIEGKNQKEIDRRESANLSVSWELLDSNQDLASRGKALEDRKVSTNSILTTQDSSKPPLPELAAVKRKSNNIRALVEQKKATLSPSNGEKSSHATSPAFASQTPHQNFSSVVSLQASSISDDLPQNGIIKPIKVSNPHLEEEQYLEKKEEGDDLEFIEELKTDEGISICLLKSLEGSKRHHNLSINIPTGSEQGENQAQVATDKAQPSKGKSPQSDTTDQSSVPTTKVATSKKTFSFSDYLFDHKSPISPNRSFWVSQFLKQKLGDEKFEKVRDLIESSANPTQLLKESPEKVLEIIGKDKRDCLVMLNFLISQNANSVTPTGETKENISKSSYVKPTEGRNVRNYKSPVSANPFLRNMFPCATEPDSGSQCATAEDMRSSRRILTDVYKPREKTEQQQHLCGSLPNLNENAREIN